MHNLREITEAALNRERYTMTFDHPCLALLDSRDAFDRLDYVVTHCTAAMTDIVDDP